MAKYGDSIHVIRQIGYAAKHDSGIGKVKAGVNQNIRTGQHGLENSGCMHCPHCRTTHYHPGERGTPCQVKGHLLSLIQAPLTERAISIMLASSRIQRLCVSDQI